MFTKLKVYIIMFTAFAMFAAVAYWYYTDTQKALRVAAQNQAKLEISVATQKEATASLQSDIRLMTETIQELNQEFALSRLNIKKIEQLFTQDEDGTSRDFGELTIQQPDYVQEKIQKGNNEVFRCIELLSGQEALQGEKDDAEFIDCLGTNTNTN
jgi:septal ring factor EnvC (AmiA/AmiB activator)